MLDLLLDDPLGLARLRLADPAVARDHRLEVVDVVQRHAADLRARGVDVARHREVDQQHRPPLARVHHLRELACLEQQVRRGGRRDDDVGPLERLGQLVEGDAGAAVAAREADRAVAPAVGDEHGPHAAVGERARGQLARLAGPDDHHLAAVERAELLPGERDRDRGQAQLALADRRLGADALAGRERGLEQLVGERPGRLLGRAPCRRRA